MKEIVFVTHNKGKAKSAEKYFNNLRISTYDFELDEPRSDDIKEIATAKVKHPGNLAYEVQGKDREEKWSDLWYIFKPQHFDKTLAEMDATERENRRKIDGSVEALKVFSEWYQKEEF